MFLPLSNTCLAAEGSSKSNWPGSDNVQVVEMPIIDRNKIKLNYNLKQFFFVLLNFQMILICTIALNLIY